MDITDIVSQDYALLAPDAPVSKLGGIFEDPTVRGVVIADDEYEGVVTRRQLSSTHVHPERTVGSLVWHVPRLAPDEDVRTVARLMIDADAQVLPVFEGEDLVGVVTVDGLLEAVLPDLDAATVQEAATDELVTVGPETPVAEALNRFREERITHLPVVDGDRAVGVVSLYDVTDLATRSTDRSQGGEGGGTDSHGGDLSSGGGRSRGGGFGAREGERDRLLDIPVRDLMSDPVRTISPEATLEEAVESMFEGETSSLVVTTGETPTGILTKTDVLDALTWEVGGNRSVQVYGTDLLDDVTYEDVVAMVDGFDDKDHSTNVLDAKIHLHEHDETLRGRSLLLARIRLHTDDGLFMASGEGYGAKHALNEAADTLERRIRDEKTRGRSKKHPGEDFWQRRFGWLLEE
ncbi:MAG: CBS domain-containing protein [Halanaeroarchaeum sp.]